MPFVTLDYVKLALRIDQDAEDVLLADYIATAHEQIEAYLNRRVFADAAALAGAGDAAGERPMLANHSIKAAACLIVGDLYRVREITSSSANATGVTTNVRLLLDPYRIKQGV